MSSSHNNISCGVPQDSILGPLLFILYINDILNCSNKVKFLLYADDTTVYIQGDDICNMAQTLNLELNNISKWIAANKLTLNIKKTKYMVSSPLLTHPPDISIKVLHTELNEVNCFKFLGVLIDNKLRWTQHIDMIKSTISVLTGVLYNFGNYLGNTCPRQIYFSLIYPHLT